MDEVSRTSGNALAKASKDDHSTGIDFGDVSIRVGALGVDRFVTSMWLVTTRNYDLGRVHTVHQLLRRVFSTFHSAVVVTRSWTETVARVLEKTFDRT